MANYRHAAAECCNISIEHAKKIDDRITKLSTDISRIHDICHFMNQKKQIFTMLYLGIYWTHICT